MSATCIGRRGGWADNGAAARVRARTVAAVAAVAVVGGERKRMRATPRRDAGIMSRRRFRLTRRRTAERIRASMSAGKRLGILVGGGPAPGINTVISSAAIEAINEGFDVVGVQDGFKWLIREDATHTRRLRI